MSGVNYTNVNIRGTEMTKICPNCKKEKLLSEFGTRTMENGEVRNQSWCTACRGKAGKE
ncbi:MAG: hypothetical protein FWF51_11150 [Chitinivibrionia bacterium]|nr:hypothetical protein [Chitinivibrionia bacterium]